PCGCLSRRCFLLRRHRLVATDLRALLHLAAAPPGLVRRLHSEPDRRLGCPAGAQPADDARRSPATAPLPHPRSRREVQRRVRSRLPKRRDRRDPHTHAGAERERTRRALGRQRPTRVPRSDADLQPPPARTRPPHLCRPLQPPSAAPLACTSPTRAGKQKRDSAPSSTPS